jgi:protein transport protein SEC61 subunit gamma-like protein
MKAKRIVDWFGGVQRRIDNRMNRIGRGEYSRIFKMAKKPTREEYVKVVQITGIGIILLGFIGFAIYYILSYVLNIPK